LEFEKSLDSTFADLYITRNWWSVKSTLDELKRDFPFSRKKIDEIFNANPNLETANELSMDDAYFTLLREQLDELKTTITIAINIMEENSINDQEEQLNIKLPEHISLGELSRIISLLDDVINSPYIKELNGGNTAYLISVDSGSNWLLIGNLCIVAIIIIGKVMKYAHEINNIIFEQKINKIKIEIMEAEKNAYISRQKEIEPLFQDMVKLEKNLIERCTKKLMQEENIDSTREAEINNIFQNGLEQIKTFEVHPSINASEKSANSFPSEQEQLKTIEDSKKFEQFLIQMKNCNDLSQIPKLLSDLNLNP
jgi:predicted RNase H-related nuclease YkuK (DUF458 family)